MNHQIKKISYLTLFITIEIVLSAVPFLGFIPLGVINATTLHIPVILAALILGKKEGAIVGFVFGFISMLSATFTPGITSFLFSPFFSLGETSGNFGSLMIAFIPRILLGYFSGLCFEKIKNKNKAVLISSFVGSMTNTILVLVFAYLFFKEPYANALGIHVNMILGVILSVIFTNGIAEAILAVLICTALYKVFTNVK